jgi:hypothetical protein
MNAEPAALSGNGLSCDTALNWGYHAGLKPSDLADIIACLRTVPPLQ